MVEIGGKAGTPYSSTGFYHLPLACFGSIAVSLWPPHQKTLSKNPQGKNTQSHRKRSRTTNLSPRSPRQRFRRLFNAKVALPARRSEASGERYECEIACRGGDLHSLVRVGLRVHH